MTWHIDFSPHIKEFRHGNTGKRGQDLRDIFDGPHIFRHIFADHAVATRRCPDKAAIFIDDAAGKTVDFRFHHIFYFGILRKTFMDPAVKLLHFFRGKGIGQT